MSIKANTANPPRNCPPAAKIYFSDYFDVPPEALADYGAFNVSPVVDLPLFVDPFLLFTSNKPKYKALHEEIIRYLKFLRDKSSQSAMSPGELKAWYCFHEVKQNCLGFCETGNKGIGLGVGFAKTLSSSLHSLFNDFGEEKVTKGSHLEKLMLISGGVGRDKISDFTTNLIKGFLVKYTETFAAKHVPSRLLRRVAVSHVEFDYEIGAWKSGHFDLPWFDDDFVLLTPEEILTKDDTWINKEDLRRDFPQIRACVENDALRAQIDNYFRSVLQSDKDKEPTRKSGGGDRIAPVTPPTPPGMRLRTGRFQTD